MKSNKNKELSSLKIGNWTFYPAFGQFTNTQGKEFFIEDRLRKLLIILTERKESIVKRSEIIEFVWGEVIVKEENLTKGIFDLRSLLKKKGITELEIRTIRNIGYRLTIHEEEAKVKVKPMFKLLIKSVVYFFLIASFLILFIRAMKYEN